MDINKQSKITTQTLIFGKHWAKVSRLDALSDISTNFCFPAFAFSTAAQ